MSSGGTNQRRMRRRNWLVSFVIFFLPTSLLALSVLLLACNGIGIGIGLLCLTTPLPPPTPPTVKPISTSINVMALQELHVNNNKPAVRGQRRSRGTNRSRRRWLKFMRPNNQSARFAARAAAFFNTSCRPRFFMTWIAPIGSFGPRELFCIETLFWSHPHACLLIVSHSLDSSLGRRLLHPFSLLGFRLAALSPDYSYLLAHTPADRMSARLLKGEVRPGHVPLGQNLSNLLRLLLLFKFGGAYLDTDVVVLRSFLPLHNAVGAQAFDSRSGHWTRLNNAVMVFDSGHPLLRAFIAEFALNFDGSKWGHNGPYLVSRVASRLAGRPGVEFTVLPPAAFYPVDWTRISRLFLGPKGGEGSEWASARLGRMREESYALHLWNRQSRGLVAESGSVIGTMMSEFCVLCNSTVHAPF